MVDLPRPGTPDVDLRPQRHGEMVVAGPVQQVQVVVVHYVGGVQDPLGNLEREREGEKTC